MIAIVGVVLMNKNELFAEVSLIFDRRFLMLAGVIQLSVQFNNTKYLVSLTA
jgi:hypothetical protein